MFKRLLSHGFISRLHSGKRSWPDTSLPGQCAVCRSWPASQVCEDCISRFTPVCRRCPTCALALPADLSRGLRQGSNPCAACLQQAPPVDASFVAVSYGWPWSDIVTRYKFGDHPGWAPFLAGMMLSAPGVQPAMEALQTSDFILPLPLSAERLQSRGFNQAWELARALASQSGTRAQADPRLLLRIRNTRPQTELKREARLANVKGAFAIDPLRAELIRGRRVLLVDDVMTSGASIFTAAEVLRAGGASHITALAFARTSPD